MLEFLFYKNKKIINIAYIDNYLNLYSYINNYIEIIIYNEYHKAIFFKISLNQVIYEKLCKYGYRYIKDYCITENIKSYITRSKNNSHKNKYLYSILYKYYHILYIYFIYTKYYTIFNGKKDYLILIDIYSKKLFNCRDHYILHSFILDENRCI